MILPLLLMVPLPLPRRRRLRLLRRPPGGVHFLLNFNSSEFNTQLRARDYYSFFATTLLACGVVFQVPVGILAVTRLGIVSVEQLKREPPLRLPGLRGGRRSAARRGPGDDADRDGAAARPLRSEYLARSCIRAARRRRAAGADHAGALGEPMAKSDRAPDGLRHPRAAQARRQGRLRGARGADGAEPLLRHRSGQHRRPLRRRRQQQRQLQLRRPGREDRGAAEEAATERGPLARPDPDPLQRRQRSAQRRPAPASSR